MSINFISKQVKANKATNKGFGIFAAEQILSGAIFLKFEGELISGQQIDDKVENYRDTFLQIDKDLYLNIDKHPSVLVNHSCNPNSIIVIDGHEAYLKSIQTINSNDEITFDYSLNWLDDDQRLFIPECFCGETNCRKTITSLSLIPKELVDNYLSLNIIPNFCYEI